MFNESSLTGLNWLHRLGQEKKFRSFQDELERVFG